MNDDNGFGVPAGWYPDPLGLPQMRWWDSHGWTEHTTEARAPVVIQEAKLAWADDDDASTRRERRDRERDDVSTDTSGGTTQATAPTAEALLELEPPSWDQMQSTEPAPADVTAAEPTPAAAEPAVAQPTAAQPTVATEPTAQVVAEEAAAEPPLEFKPLFESSETATSSDAFANDAFAPGGQAAAAAASAAAASAAAAATTNYLSAIDSNPFAVSQAHAARAAQRAAAALAAGRAPSANTAGAWIIALLPLAQLVLMLLIVSAAAGTHGTNVGVMLSILIAPYFISIPFAIADRRELQRQGYANPAPWLWTLLTGPVYLLIRAIRIVMSAGNGFGPILVWSALVLIQLGSLVAIPGLLISALPQTFSQEAAQSIQNDAAVFGSTTKVSCPSPPATVIGQQFTCKLKASDLPKTYIVTASLQRENGWIAWHVENWGYYDLAH